MDMSLRDCYKEKRQELSITCPEAAATYYPAFINIRSTMARKRNKNIPPVPTNYATIPIIETFPVLYARNNLLLDRQFLFFKLELLSRRSCFTNHRASFSSVGIYEAQNCVRRRE